MSQTITATLNAQSNLAVSTLLENAQNRKRPNKKRIRDETQDNVQQSPPKKRKIDIPRLKIQHSHDDDSNHHTQAFGFSSDDDDDDPPTEHNHAKTKKDSASDNESDDALNISHHTELNQSTNSLQNDPYWNMMQSINDSKDNLMDLDDLDDSDNKEHSTDNNEFKGVSIQIDIDESSMFNVDDTKDETDKKKKKPVRRYQKWQRDQGIICTQTHLALLLYRARFMTLLCSDYELQGKMMSILPLKFHPNHEAFNGIYTNITFAKLRRILHWFVTTFHYDVSAKQFELRCRKAKDRIPCALFQLMEYIEDIGDGLHKRKCSVSHLNMLFLTLLWSFNIPARMVYVLRPISHILNVNKIYDNDYMDIMNTYFVSKACICQQMDEGIVYADDDDIEMDDICTNNDKKSLKDRLKRRENIGVEWSENDDIYLWNHRDEEVAVLGLHFGRSRTGIRNRLEQILNPETDAYKRVHGDKRAKDDDDNKAVKRRRCMDMDDKKKKKKKQKKRNRRERIKECTKENTNKKWSKHDDVYVWEYRDDPVHILSDTLDRTKTSIKMRLETLRDTTSKARERLIKNLPSTSKSKIKQNKDRNINKGKVRTGPDFSYLGQNFIYNRKKGSMVQCIEVFVSDRNEWVHVLLDKGRTHIDSSENNLFQCDCDKNTNKIAYAVSVDKFGFMYDVTPRYSEIWSVALKNRVMHNTFYNEMLLKWERENEETAFLYEWQCIVQHELWKHILKQDRIQIQKCIEGEPIPKSEGLFRNHPLFVIEKFVKKYEAIYPKDESHVIGKIKRQNVYPIKNLRNLHTRERWYKLGYVVEDGEGYIKQVKTSHMSKSEEEFTDLFGNWQCVKYVAPTIGPKDKLPTNTRGNIELWSDQHLPKGCVHITQSGAVFAAKRMEIEYAKAMVGFDQRKGRSVPVFNGIVVHESYEEECCKVIKQMDVKRREREKEKEQKMMCGLWRMLVQGIMVQHQLQIQQREKEANKRIMTTKEFNAMVHKDHIEDL